MIEKWKQYIRFLTDLSVKTKVLGMTVTLVLLMGFTSVLFTNQLLSTKLSDDLDRRAISIANDLSSRSADMTIIQDIFQLNKLLEGTLENHPDIEYIFIIDQDQQVVADTFGQVYQVSETLIDVNQPKISGGESQTTLEIFDSEIGPIHDVAAPILEGDRGFVRVGLNENQIYETINLIILTILMITLVIGAVGVTISILLTKILDRNIQQLMQISEDVAEGMMEGTVKIPSNDELGKLGDSFNHMIERLNKKKKESNDYLHALQLRNSELSILHHLSMGTSDTKKLKQHLKEASAKLIDDIQLYHCYIEVQLEDKFISTNQGKFAYQSNNGTKLHDDQGYYYQAPIFINHEKAGQMIVYFKETPDAAMKKFIDSFARQLSVLCENIKLWNEVKYKEQLRLKLLNRVITAQEEERKRIARELHDETSQSITSILVGLTLVEEIELKEVSKRKIQEIKQITEKTLEEIHYISWSLRPSVLDDLGLIPAIEKYVSEFIKKFNIDVDVHVVGMRNQRLSNEVEVTIYRVVQESLTNAVRHAKAEEISIIIRKADNILQVIVEDDGVGFNVSDVIDGELTKDHLGLKGMQERIESIGGQMIIESAVGIGTSIYVKGIKTGGDTDEAEDYAS